MPISINKYDRRSFIKKLSFGVAGIILGKGRKDNYRRPSEYFILISDPHIHYKEDFSSAIYSKDGNKIADNLKEVINRILNQSALPQGVIVNGDLAWRNGHPAHYREFRRLLKPLLQHNIDVYMTLGNHDKRKTFFNTLSNFKSNKYSVINRHVMVINSPHAYLVLLDSLYKVEETPGRLGAVQLNWLDDLLATLRDKPVNLFAHHYPETGNGKGLLDYPQLRKVMIRHNHVKAFIFGHSHKWNLSTKQGFYHINIPSTAYAFNDKQPLGFVHARFGAEGIDLKLDCLDRHHPWHAEQALLGYSNLKLKNRSSLNNYIQIKTIYPNPFRTSAHIKFHLLNTSYVSINVYTIVGRKVKTVMENKRLLPGDHFAQFSGNGLASGNYLVHIRTKDQAKSQVVTLIK